MESVVKYTVTLKSLVPYGVDVYTTWSSFDGRKSLVITCSSSESEEHARQVVVSYVNTLVMECADDNSSN